MTLTTGPRLLAPGWIPREPGLETYWVRPGGVTCVRVDQGDEVSVVDVEGGQRAEVTTVAVHPGDPEGAGALGLRQGGSISPADLSDGPVDRRAVAPRGRLEP